MSEAVVASTVNKTRKNMEDKRIEAAMNEHVRDAVRPAMLGAAGLYVLFAISHLFVLPSWAQPVMVSLASATAIAFLLMHILIARRPLPLQWVHPFVFAALILPLLNTLVHMYLLQDAFQSTNVMLIMIGAGIFLLSSWWWVMTITTSVVSWFVVGVLFTANVPADDWIHYGYMLLIAAVLSAIAHVGRLRAFERIERLRHTDERRQHDLERALQAVQQSELNLQQAHAELEQRVHDQTVALEQANVELSREVAERRRTEADTQFLAAATAQMSLSLDYAATLESVVRHAVPYLADCCIVDLLENNRLHQAAVAHAVPEKLQAVRELRGAIPFNEFAPFGATKVLRDGQPEMVPRIPVDDIVELIQSSPEYAQLLQELQPFGFIVVPLMVGNVTIGMLSLVSSESRRVFEQRHLQLATDLAHRAALAVEHARLYQRANQAIVARDAFVSIAAHELKSPLTALRGYAQLLYERVNANPAADAFQRRALQTVLTQSRRLEQLIATMLDVSLIENDQLALNLEPVYIPDILRQVVEGMRMMLDLHVIELQLDPTQPVAVRGDAMRLEQVFQNLLQNAVKYSPNGGKVVVGVRLEDRQVVVSVADTGIGIAAVDIPRLFQRFYRASSAEHSNIKGMGIGLYVVREIVERHGGTISVESVEWEGTVFTVRLPSYEVEQVG